MTTHRHTYRTIAFWTLTLPDDDGFSEQFISWECPSCGDVAWSTGTFHRTATAMSPDAWKQVADQERRQRTPLASAAQRTERERAPTEDKYSTFTPRRRHAYPALKTH